jgi:gliding motility-associated-like protein
MDPACTDSDTVTISFEDPSSQERRLSYAITLDYGTHSCPNVSQDTCSNIRILEGVFPPRPVWNITITGECMADFTDPIVSNIDSATCSAVVNHIASSAEDSLDLLWISSQDAFLTVDYDSGQIEENRFIEFIGILERGLQSRLDTACYPFGKCYVDKAPCVDVIFDTILYPMPVHLGGRWNIINQFGSTALNDVSIIQQDGKNYRIEITPGARYIGPDNIEVAVSEVDSMGRVVDLDSTANFIFFWEELWVTDTLMRLIPREEANGNCPPCGSQIITYDSLLFPAIPSTFCPTLELEFNPPVNSKISGDTVLCEGRFVVLSGPEDKVSYEWSNSTTSRFNFINQPGKVWLTTVDSNGCVTSDTVNVLQAIRPDFQLDADTSMVCQGDCITFDIVGDSVAGYLWSNRENDTLTTYCFTQDTLIWVEVEDISGCFYRDTFTFQIDDLVSIDAGENMVLTCDSNGVTLIPDTLGLAGVPYFEWQGPGIDDNNRFDPMPTVDQPGVYLLFAGEDPMGCLGRDSIFVAFEDGRPIANAGENQLLNCAVTSVRLDGSASEMGPDFDITWQGPGINPSNEKDINPLVDQPGEYVIFNCNTITGCCDTDTVAIGLNDSQPIADAGAVQTISCDTTMVTIGGNSSTGFDIIYMWTGPGINASNESLRNPTVDQAGQYFLRVLDTVSMCDAFDQVEVMMRGIIPTADAGLSKMINCLESTVRLGSSNTSSGPTVSYEWTGPGINDGNRNNNMPVVSEAGTYILVVTESEGNCTDTDTVMVTEDVRKPMISVSPQDTIDCNVRSLRLNGIILNDNGRMRVEWTGPGIDPQDQGSLTPSVNIGGNYTLTVTDTVNGCFATGMVTIIEEFDPPVADAGPDLAINCLQDTVQLQGQTMNYDPDWAQFSWDGPDIDFQKMFELMPTVTLPGTYVFTINSVNDQCDVSDTMEVKVDTIKPKITATVDKLVGCNGDTVQLDATISGGTLQTVIWSTSNGNLVGPNNTSSTQADQSGVYNVLVIGVNGCQNEDSVEVEDWNAFNTEIQTEPTCEGQSDGFARIRIQGGNFPFTFSLDDGPFETDNTYINLASGTYSLDIRDRDGCELNTSFEIQEIPIIGLSPETFESNFCESDNIVIGEDFGLSDVVYTWLDDPSAGIRRSVSDTGTFVLRISNDCDTVEMTYIVESDLLPEQQDQVFRMPNAFTPNGDNLNDEFGPVWQIERLENLNFVLYNLQIHNRYGTMIFETSDVNEMWDGVFSGELVQPQGYFYRVEARVEDCRGTVLQFKQDGTVTLLR